MNLEFDLLVFCVEHKLDAVLEATGQSSNVQEVIARLLGQVPVGWQLVSVKVEERLANDSVLFLIASGIKSPGHDTSLLDSCQ